MEESMIRAILAHDSYWGIGKDGDLPWPKNPDDLKWFKECTEGGVVVMGKTTWDSLPNKPLPKRNNVVVTSAENREPGPFHFMTFETARGSIPQMNSLQDVWIIGGAQLLEGMLDLVEELWLNDVGGVYNCDTFLPKQKITEQFRMGTVEVLSFGIVTKWVRK